MRRDPHFSDAQLLLELDGELSARDARQLRAHLAECWQCRARRQELERTIGDFARLHRRQNDRELPPHAAPRALLKARLEQLFEAQPYARRNWTWVLAMAACVALFAVMFMARHPAPSHRTAIVSIPDSRLTPGAALLATRESVCAQPNTKNRTVPVALRRKVFEAYGLSNAEPRDYEVDYLITPALGGADDIHNLWPQPYSATVWNAEVKDALEDRLRDLVCDGSLDLTEAQREIAVNWIAAYKKYFHTDRPLADHDKQ
jgi:hypothetical protein